MKNKCTDLHNHLDSEIKLYNFYFSFLQELQTEIISGNTDAIDEMLHNIHFSERDFGILRQERNDVLHKIVGHEGDVEFIELSDILSEKEFQEVLEKRNILNGLVEDVRHYNEVNKIILENALTYTHQRLSHFSKPQNDSYGNTGKTKEKKYKNSVNRSV
jgi:flagellar biosynthesis/type III secretory pathway chaperone